MKKVILSLAVVAMFGFASCSKEKTCDCTVDVSGISSTTEVVIEDGDCEDMDASVTSMGFTTTTTCVEQ